MSDLREGAAQRVGPDAPNLEPDARQLAIKQIERRRRFHIELAVWTLATVLLVLVWATSEYHNAAG